MAIYDDPSDPSTRRFRRSLPRNELTQPAPAATTSQNPFDTMFSDQYTALLERLGQNRIKSLSQPFQDNDFSDVLNLIRSRVGNLTSQPVPTFSAANPLLGDFMNTARGRIAELNAEPFSAQEEARLRTKALGNVEELRAAGKRRVNEDAAARGLGETSGLIQHGYQEVDRRADANRTTAEADLAMYLTDQRNQRRNAAAQLAGQLAAAGEGEASRNLQGQMASAQFGAQREGQVMQLAGMLADLSAQRRGEQRANENDIMNIAMMLSNLQPQRMALLMNMLNSSGGNDLGGLFNNQLNLSNTQANARNRQSAESAAMMSGLGQLLGFLGTRGWGGSGSGFGADESVP